MSLKNVLIVATLIFIASIILFSWQLFGTLNSSFPIDSNRFSNFGSFLSGILGFVNLIVLIFAFKETKLQSFENAYFSLLQIHDSIVKDLKSNKGALLDLNNGLPKFYENYMCENLDDANLITECINYREKKDPTEYFEALYRILHIRRKYRNEKLKEFFDNENWRIGHYLRSYISILEFIDENSSFDSSKKQFYARIIQSRSTSDELRLIYYYVASLPDESEDLKKYKQNITRIMQTLDFFKPITDTLILASDKNIFRIYSAGS